MANIHTWRVLELLCKPHFDNQDNVVFEVVWECRSHNPENPEIIAQCSDKTEIPYAPGSFASYETLTEEQVIGWVKATLGPIVNGIEKAMDERVWLASLPPVVSPPLPWAQN